MGTKVHCVKVWFFRRGNRATERVQREMIGLRNIPSVTGGSSVPRNTMSIPNSRAIVCRLAPRSVHSPDGYLSLKVQYGPSKSFRQFLHIYCVQWKFMRLQKRSASCHAGSSCANVAGVCSSLATGAILAESFILQEGVRNHTLACML